MLKSINIKIKNKCYKKNSYKNVQEANGKSEIIETIEE